ncbi:MAG: hypothetical protein EAZ97_05155, partial [Bacteroidetes bacterium]
NYPLQNEEMILRAEAEDEIESKFEEMERKLESSQKEKERLSEEKDRLSEEKDRLQEEKEQILLQAEQKETLAIENFLRLGLNPDQIAVSLQISVNKILKIKDKLGI